MLGKLLRLFFAVRACIRNPFFLKNKSAIIGAKVALVLNFYLQCAALVSTTKRDNAQLRVVFVSLRNHREPPNDKAFSLGTDISIIAKNGKVFSPV